MRPNAPDPYEITTDPARFDVAAIHEALAATEWSPGIPRERVEHALQHSLGFALLHHGDDGHPAQVGFARVVTDQASFAYLCDVYVLAAHRGRGLGRRLVATVRADARLQGLRRWMLVTRNAHGLYAPFGFHSPAHPERVMEVLVPAPWAAAR
jgi:GNAT superfamily N-acetyltransferase